MLKTSRNRNARREKKGIMNPRNGKNIAVNPFPRQLFSFGILPIQKGGGTQGTKRRWQHGTCKVSLGWKEK